MGIEVEKGPGYDWSVTYRWEDGKIDTLSVFGVLTIEKAIEEAHDSLMPFKFPDGSMSEDMLYDLVAAKRLDVP
jgi:hypothetical protein